VTITTNVNWTKAVSFLMEKAVGQSIDTCI